MFEHTMCSSNLQGTQVKETGRYTYHTVLLEMFASLIVLHVRSNLTVL